MEKLLESCVSLGRNSLLTRLHFSLRVMETIATLTGLSRGIFESGSQSQNLTHWSVFRGPESPTYQPMAKSIPRAEKRPWRRCWLTDSSGHRWLSWIASLQPQAEGGRKNGPGAHKVTKSQRLAFCLVR
jgi:hypothetical protein